MRKRIRQRGKDYKYLTSRVSKRKANKVKSELEERGWSVVLQKSGDKKSGYYYNVFGKIPTK